MGRHWQTLLLLKQYPLFEYSPFENLISKNQKAYYKALANSDKLGESTQFIVFMLSTINASLDELLRERIGPITNEDRIQLFLATSVKEKLISKIGDKSNTIYYPIK